MFPFDDVITSSAGNSSSMHRPLSNETYRCSLSKGRVQFWILCVYISIEIDKVQVELANQGHHVHKTLIGDWEWICDFTFHAQTYTISLVPLNQSFHLARPSRSVSCSYRYEARYYPTSTIDRYALLITRVGYMSGPILKMICYCRKFNRWQHCFHCKICCNRSNPDTHHGNSVAITMYECKSEKSIGIIDAIHKISITTPWTISEAGPSYFNELDNIWMDTRWFN